MSGGRDTVGVTDVDIDVLVVGDLLVVDVVEAGVSTGADDGIATVVVLVAVATGVRGAAVLGTTDGEVVTVVSGGVGLGLFPQPDSATATSATTPRTKHRKTGPRYPIISVGGMVSKCNFSD